MRVFFFLLFTGIFLVRAGEEGEGKGYATGGGFGCLGDAGDGGFRGVRLWI